MSKHTPGPWRVAPPSIGVAKIVTADKLKAVGEANWYNEQAEANARLIAAAPDLLAALVNIISADDAGELTNEIINAGRAAIKKARGE